MRWPVVFTPWRVTAAVRRLRDDRDRLAAELEHERQQHLTNLLHLLDITSTSALQVGNLGERVWPEQLVTLEAMARNAGHPVLILCTTQALVVHPVPGVD